MPRATLGLVCDCVYVDFKPSAPLDPILNSLEGRTFGKGVGEEDGMPSNSFYQRAEHDVQYHIYLALPHPGARDR